jgi:transglutaminase-like putative cysteine protease
MSNSFSPQHSVPTIRLEFSIQLNYEVEQSDSDFIFSIHAAKTDYQLLCNEYLNTNQNIDLIMYENPATYTRLLRLKAMPGALHLNYGGIVDLNHFSAPPNQIHESPVADLPGSVISYLYPSRYCQSDSMGDIAIKEFGGLDHGYERIQTICNWVCNHVRFQANSSTAHTTAIDTYLSKAGVCRDFAHLMIALCRALSIPARFVTGIDYGSDPILGPTDFHAYVEVYLDGRWYIFDPSGVAIPMGFLRICTGHDAADTAITSIFGAVLGSAPIISIRAIPNPSGRLELPMHITNGLSSDLDYRELANR